MLQLPIRPGEQLFHPSGRRQPEIGLDIGDRVQGKSGGLGEGVFIQNVR